jgi:hypothetical protein
MKRKEDALSDYRKALDKIRSQSRMTDFDQETIKKIIESIGSIDQYIANISSLEGGSWNNSTLMYCGLLYLLG